MHKLIVPLAHNIPDTAGLLSVSTRHVWRLIADGKLSVIRAGRRTLVPRKVLERFIARGA